MRWAVDGHTGQVDKAGRPYLIHICEVIAGVETDEEKAAAALHDLAEDADNTQHQLMLIGAAFRGPVYDAVKALTKNDHEPYDDYLSRVAADSIARRVKLADLRHNSDLSRLPNATDKDRKRALKYHKAIERLEAEQKGPTAYTFTK